MANSSPETQVGQAYKSDWRGSSLLAALLLSALVGTIWLAAVLATTPGMFRTAFAAVDIALVAGVWLAALLRIPDIVRFAIIETAYFAASANSILVYGTAPCVPVLLGLFILLAGVHCHWRCAAAAAVASLLLIAAGWWGWVAGVLPVGPRFPGLVPSQHAVWMRTMFAQLLAGGVITAVAALVIREIQTMLQRLRIAEEKFAKAFQVCPDAMIITELETGRFLEVNDSHERLTGFRREQVLGKTSIEIGSFADESDRESFSGPLRALGTLNQGSRQIRGSDGRPIDVLYSATSFDLEGLSCVLTIVQDITERRRTEAALVANEERFRSFIENASVGIYRSTPDGRIIMANPALLRILGYDSFQELASRNLETDRYEASYRRSEFRERIERAGALSGWEASWERRDGKSIFVRESANVVRGADGGVLYYDGIIEDISERKKAEQDLRESEERFRNLTAAAFEGIVITEKGRILDINDQGLRMFGYGRDEMIGREAIDFVSPASRPVVADAIRSEREITYEHQLIRRDGSLFHAEARAKMMRTDGRVLRMTAIRDVTERREAERRQKSLEEQLSQTQKMEALGTLAGGIAHDFNNILTGILGNLQLAEMELTGEHPAFAALTAADQASRRARDLVARILSFSRLEPGGRAPSSLGPVVLEAVQLLRVGLPAEVEIRTAIDSSCAPVAFDPGQIHQVIMNLGTNSAHAMRERGGIITVELHQVAPGAALRERHLQVLPVHTVCLTLRDDGSGMEESVLKRIFEPFYTTKTFGHGTGLGLAMVHAIMKSHNGAIVVESTPGSGTTFDLYFPAAAGQAAGPKPEKQAAGRGMLAPFGNGRAIMLVDDDDAVRKIGGSLLERLGFVPATFSRAAEALEAFRRAPAGFAAVVSDLTMPEMTGLELARQVLALRPGVPIILTTGYLHGETQQKARESGVRCVISKPFEVQELTAQIRAALGEAPA